MLVEILLDGRRGMKVEDFIGVQPVITHESDIIFT
jgi:hypothetical protein